MENNYYYYYINKGKIMNKKNLMLFSALITLTGTFCWGAASDDDLNARLSDALNRNDPKAVQF